MSRKIDDDRKRRKTVEKHSPIRPRRRSRSPAKRKSITPKRRSRSPTKRKSITPKRPRRRSRSPVKKRSVTPKRRSRSRRRSSSRERRQKTFYNKVAFDNCMKYGLNSGICQESLQYVDNEAIYNIANIMERIKYVNNQKSSVTPTLVQADKIVSKELGKILHPKPFYWPESEAWPLPSGVTISYVRMKKIGPTAVVLSDNKEILLKPLNASDRITFFPEDSDKPPAYWPEDRSWSSLKDTIKELRFVLKENGDFQTITVVLKDRDSFQGVIPPKREETSSEDVFGEDTAIDDTILHSRKSLLNEERKTLEELLKYIEDDKKEELRALLEQSSNLENKLSLQLEEARNNETRIQGETTSKLKQNGDKLQELSKKILLSNKQASETTNDEIKKENYKQAEQATLEWNNLGKLNQSLAESAFREEQENEKKIRDIELEKIQVLERTRVETERLEKLAKDEAARVIAEKAQAGAEIVLKEDNNIPSLPEAAKEQLLKDENERERREIEEAFNKERADVVANIKAIEEQTKVAEESSLAKEKKEREDEISLQNKYETEGNIDVYKISSLGIVKNKVLEKIVRDKLKPAEVIKTNEDFDKLLIIDQLEIAYKFFADIAFATLKMTNQSVIESLPNDQLKNAIEAQVTNQFLSDYGKYYKNCSLLNNLKKGAGDRRNFSDIPDFVTTLYKIFKYDYLRPGIITQKEIDEYTNYLKYSFSTLISGVDEYYASIYNDEPNPVFIAIKLFLPNGEEKVKYLNYFTFKSIINKLFTCQLEASSEYLVAKDFFTKIAKQQYKLSNNGADPNDTQLKTQLKNMYERFLNTNYKDCDLVNKFKPDFDAENNNDLQQFVIQLYNMFQYNYLRPELFDSFIMTDAATYAFNELENSYGKGNVYSTLQKQAVNSKKAPIISIEQNIISNDNYKKSINYRVYFMYLSTVNKLYICDDGSLDTEYIVANNYFKGIAEYLNKVTYQVMNNLYSMLAKRYSFCPSIQDTKTKYLTDDFDPFLLSIADKRFVIVLYKLFIKNYTRNGLVSGDKLNEANSYLNGKYEYAYGLIEKEPEVVAITKYASNKEDYIKWFTYLIYKNMTYSLILVGNPYVTQDTFKAFFDCNL